MSLTDLWAALTSDYAPLLPSAQSLVWARHLLWSLVMAAVGMGVSSRMTRLPRFSRCLPWALALWAWVPGSWGASYWLGLAFQIPSLSAAFLALSVLFHAPVNQPFTLRSSVQRHHFWGVTWTLLAAVIGLVLMLDTFAVFDFSVYQWGFSPAAVALALTLALLPWVVSGMQGLLQPPVWSLLAALAVFLLTRWPSGNVWDAVLDPWLCLVAWVLLLRAPWRRS
jgi:hypothetical protein